MRKLVILLTLIVSCHWTFGQKMNSDKIQYFICSLTPDTYHDHEFCGNLLPCTGGKRKQIKDLTNLKPCRKCAWPQYIESGFIDVKRVLGVRERNHVVDTLGTGESGIYRRDGFTFRVTGTPSSRTVNMIQFYPKKWILFDEDTLLSKQFFENLGLQFDNCKADTVRYKTPNPVTKKLNKTFSIVYRGCAIVEPRERHEDISKYYYELTFLAKEGDLATDLEKIQLVLRKEM
jgi:hypothetical protein